MNELVTTKQLCDRLKVTRQAIQNWRNEGMPFIKYGKLVRFEYEKVIEWLENRG